LNEKKKLKNCGLVFLEKLYIANGCRIANLMKFYENKKAIFKLNGIILKERFL